MAKAYASTIIEAPVEAVWATVRDFDALPAWNPAVTDSEIEDGMASDVVGCIRSFHLGDGTHVRERLLSLDDSRYCFTYNFEKPAFPVENYVAGMELIPVTNGDRTFVQWWAHFDEKPEDKGRFVEIVSRDVFAAGLSALAAKVKGAQAPEGASAGRGCSRPRSSPPASSAGRSPRFGRRCATSPAWAAGTTTSRRCT
jgi:uncharacterized protein YndB with AHSA1/START domain